MHESSSLKKGVLVDIVLHTVIIIVITLMVSRSVLLSVNPLWMIVFVFAVVALTFYTVYRIVRYACEMVEPRAKELSVLLDEIHNQRENLNQYVQALNQCADIMNANQKTIVHNLKVLTRYGNRMNELVEAIDTMNDSTAKPSDAFYQESDQQGK